MQNPITESQYQAPRNIPNHVIFENILPRLPVKPLIRFKYVSKHWLSTISSPEFAKSQLKFSTSSSSPQFLLFLYHHRPPRRVVSISFDECSRVKELVNLDFTYNFQDIYVVGSCNGLICLHNKQDKFCFWNPATRYYHYFNGPEFDEHNNDSILVLGFGYVSSIDDYRIACLSLSNDHASVNVYIFSLNASKWVGMASFDNDGLNIDLREACVMINDTLYWPPVMNRNMTNSVVAVNLVNGQLSKIPLTDVYVSSAPKKAKLFKMKGRLSFCCYDILGGLSVVWMLKQNGSGWLKLYELYLRNIDLLYSTESGKCLILKNDSDSHQLMLCDPSQIHLRKFEGGLDLDDYLYIASASTLEYKESLVSPIVSAEKKDENEVRVQLNEE